MKTQDYVVMADTDGDVVLRDNSDDRPVYIALDQAVEIAEWIITNANDIESLKTNSKKIVDLVRKINDLDDD